ncbi:MAG: hypothetical protein Q8R36_03900 [bacterium]|nr:hypothetical protein [bacterium]
MQNAEVKNLLLDQLTDTEIIIFYRWMRGRYRTDLPDIFDLSEIENVFFNNVGTHAVYSFAHYVLFEHHIPKRCNILRQGIHDKILEFLPQFKEKLHTSPYATSNDTATAVKLKISSCFATTDLTAWNAHTGEVIISWHALERFYQRARDIEDVLSPEEPLPKRLLNSFKKSFARAKPVEIDPTEKTKRIISNDFKPSVYLLDQAGNMRFVIPETKQDKKSTIVTVERPK